MARRAACLSWCPRHTVSTGDLRYGSPKRCRLIASCFWTLLLAPLPPRPTHSAALAPAAPLGLGVPPRCHASRDPTDGPRCALLGRFASRPPHSGGRPPLRSVRRCGPGYRIGLHAPAYRAMSLRARSDRTWSAILGCQAPHRGVGHLTRACIRLAKHRRMGGHMPHLRAIALLSLVSCSSHARVRNSIPESSQGAVYDEKAVDQAVTAIDLPMPVYPPAPQIAGQCGHVDLRYVV